MSSGLGSIASGFGDIFSSALSYSNAEQNRDFQLGMDRTKYQRAVADMRAAGLNPYLMAGGTGAAGGTGSSMAPAGNPGTSALQGMKIMAEVENIDQNTKLVKNKKEVMDPIVSVMKMVEGIIDKPTSAVAKNAPKGWDKLRSTAKEVKGVNVWDRLKKNLSRMQRGQ